MRLAYYKVHESAHDPVFSTQQAACFDLCACLVNGEKISGVTEYNVAIINSVVRDQQIVLPAHSRMLIPTGLIFDIPQGYSVRLHPRSGIAYKRGIMLSNCEGVIDSDYYHQTYVALFNTTNVEFVVGHGDRIAQGEMVQDLTFHLIQTQNIPQAKTDRNGGFGSTGQ